MEISLSVKFLRECKVDERPSYFGSIHNVMVIIIENGHSKLNTNPGWCCLHFTKF